MTDETVQPEVTESVVAAEVAPEPTPIVAPDPVFAQVPDASASVADESFFQRVEKAVEELGASAHNLVDWLRQEIAKVRS
ncbi:MAG TPA: hypothetical protein VM621_10540 [Luteibacter sp.]|uniref:hypothetical protein n=1 Tax=Luteibacter sp. TaxID=1886636 RepID=UPI002B9A2BD1|nr:hypothetical protein [Luteibacter sp.]HVI55475.1 hypothetical protein [Luteibacter sp.]